MSGCDVTLESECREWEGEGGMRCLGNRAVSTSTGTDESWR